MKKVFLGLGSNVGDRKKNIEMATSLLKKEIKDVKIAPIYISRAAGYKAQDDFFNTVIMGYTCLSVEELFGFIKEIEKRVGRVYRFHWGPREIDIDILLYEDICYESEILIIPHPRLHERDFVLKPLMDIEPELEHPKLKKSIKDLFQGLKENFIIGKI